MLLLDRFTHSCWAERVQGDHLDWCISSEVEAHISVLGTDSNCPRGCPTLLGGEN